MKGKLLFLGTGSSSGVPEIACDCSVCKSLKTKNIRLRPSCLIKVDNNVFLLDISPDFRQQALKYKIDHIDGLILTHGHYDHVGGLDEIRTFNLREKRAIDCLLSSATYSDIKKSFYYIFQQNDENHSLSAQLNFFIMEKDFGKISFKGMDIEYFSYFQKETKVTGYRFGNLAYISDIRKYSDKIFDHLKDLDILILSALRKDISPMHFNLDEAISFAKKVNAKKTYFTHIAHDIDHYTVEKNLPENINLAYDGLEIEFEL